MAYEHLMISEFSLFDFVKLETSQTPVWIILRENIIWKRNVKMQKSEVELNATKHLFSR